MERMHPQGRMAVAVMIAAAVGCVACASGWAYGQPRGFGGFAAPETYELLGRPQSVVVADFNNDGVPDIAVAHRDDPEIPLPYQRDRIAVFPGRGDGTFESPTSFVYSGVVNPSHMATGDLDGSGNQDLVVSTEAEQKVYVLRGHGDGAFSVRETHELPHSPRAVRLGDLNGNGILDIAVVHPPSSNAVSVLLGVGDGTFTHHTTFDVGASISSSRALALADFNGNGVLDVATMVSLPSPAGRAVSVHPGNGDGTFGSPETFEISGSPGSLAVGDLRRIGVQDIAVPNPGTNGPESIGILLGRGDGTFEPEQRYDMPGNPGLVSLADVDGNGILDILSTVTGDSISVLLGNGDGTFQSPQSFPGGPRINAIATGDFTLNGLPDVVVGNAETWDASISVLLNQTEPCIADWNGDGEVDINDFFGYLADFEAGDPRADLNNDGEIDINDFFLFLDEFEKGC